MAQTGQPPHNYTSGLSEIYNSNKSFKVEFETIVSCHYPGQERFAGSIQGTGNIWKYGNICFSLKTKGLFFTVSKL